MLNKYFICKMFYKYLFYFLLVFSAIIILISAKGELEIDPGDWQVIGKGWAQQDYIDEINGLKRQYFYDNNNAKHQYDITITEAFIDNNKQKDPEQLIRVSFKFWCWYESGNIDSIDVIYGPDQKLLFDKIKYRYCQTDLDKLEWHSLYYIVSQKDLNKFKIETNFKVQMKRFIAFKDFEITYEIKEKQTSVYNIKTNRNLMTNTTTITTTKSNITKNNVNNLEDEIDIVYNNWAKIKPRVDPGHIIYFTPKCNNYCTVRLLNDKSIKTAKISMSYYFEEKGSIEINGWTDKINVQTSQWIHIDGQIDLNEKSFEIKVKPSLIDGKSFAQIMNIKLTNIEYITGVSETEIDCMINNNKCKISENSFWIDITKVPIDSESKYYYMPYNTDNSIVINQNKDDLNEKDYCLEFGYLLTEKIDVEIYVNYNVWDVKNKDEFTMIKPIYNNWHSSSICLRDLIAVKANMFNFTISVNHMSVNEIIFLRNINVKPNNEPKVIESINYLTNVNEWKQIVHDKSELLNITYIDNKYEFTGKVMNKLHQNAYLSSDWFKYHKELNIKPLEYWVTVTDEKTFNYFTIRPKVCDWLSHCEDVIVKYDTTSQQTKQKYTYQLRNRTADESNLFIRLMYYIEYYKPQYIIEDTQVDDVMFTIENIHLGQPIKECNDIGTDKIKQQILLLPNDNTMCYCKENWMGDKCDTFDKCYEIIGTKDQTVKDECENSGGVCVSDGKNDYKCVCAKSNQQKKCTDHKFNNNSKNWNIENTSKMFPTSKTDNLLILDFDIENINNYDIQLTINYINKLPVNDMKMTIAYRSHDGTGKPVYILQNEPIGIKSDSKSENPIKIELNNFVEKLTKTFKIELNSTWLDGEIENDNFYLKNFSIKITKKIDNSLTFLKHWSLWSNPPNDNPVFQQNWFTNSFVEQHDKKEPLSYKYTGTATKTWSTVMLSSPWIKNGDFSKTKNSYNLNIIKHNKDKVDLKINQHYVYQTNDLTVIDVTKNIELKDQTIVDINIPNDNIQYESFRLYFEVTYKLITAVNNKDNEEDLKVELNIEKLSLGDGCINQNTDTLRDCNGGICDNTGPGSYQCKCIIGFGGIDCQIDTCNKDELGIKRYDYCKRFAAKLGTDSKCIPISDSNGFQCECLTNEFVWFATNKRCSRLAYETHRQSCQTKNCDVLTMDNKNIRLSHPELPQLNHAYDEQNPYYFTDKTNDILKFKITGLKDTDDKCFRFKYMLNKNSKLGIAYESMKTLDLIDTVIDNNAQWFPQTGLGQRICANQLSHSLAENFAINFKAYLPDNGLVVIQKAEETDPDPQRLSEKIHYLSHWNNTSDFNKYWSLNIPEKFIISGDNQFKFDINKQDSHQKVYLLSNWIKRFSDDTAQTIKLRFKYLKNDKNKNYQVDIYRFNANMVAGHIKKIEPHAEPQSVDIDVDDNYFRVGFVFDNYTDINSNNEIILSSIDLGDSCVNNSLIRYNCDKRGICQPKSSTHSQCNCYNDYDGDNCQYDNNCNIGVKIIGQTDEMSGTDYCNKHCKKCHKDNSCINLGKLKKSDERPFMCNCTEKAFWDLYSFDCRDSPKCSSDLCDYKKSFCVDNEIDGPKCKPLEGYINIIKDGKDKIEPINLCNTEHRLKLNYEKDPCADKNAVCVAYGYKKDEYLCNCPQNYKKEKVTGTPEREATCKSIVCMYPTLNKCSQRCIDLNEPISDTLGYKCECVNNDLYELDSSDRVTCKLKDGKTCNEKCTKATDAFCDNAGNCQCRDGYRFDIDKCVPDVNHFKLLCPDGKVKPNSFECDCSGIYEIDENTKLCRLKPICGTGGMGRKDCDNKEAVCVYRKDNEYECECPEGSDWINNKEKCVYNCNKTISNTMDTYNFKCKSIGAVCNPNKVNANVVDTKQYCECNPGYVWNTNVDRCVVSVYTATFELTFKPLDVQKELEINKNTLTSGQFDDKYNYDTKGLNADILSAVKLNDQIYDTQYTKLWKFKFNRYLLRQVVDILLNADYIQNTNERELNDFVGIKLCQPITGEKEYRCEITVTLDKPLSMYGKLGDKASKFCYPSANSDTNECYYINIIEDMINKQIVSSNIHKPEQMFSLAFNPDQFKQIGANKYKPCNDETKNLCDNYSDCHPIDEIDSSLYNCKCNVKYFVINESKVIEHNTVPNYLKSGVQEKCSVRADLCDKGCPTEHRECFQKLPNQVDGHWEAPIVCNCSTNYKFNHDQTQCVDVCKHNECGNHGKCKHKGRNGFSCLCDNGWNGDKCNNEFEPALGGWIAGIVVLAVLSAVLIGVAAFFFCRSKKAKKHHGENNNNNNQHLNEYIPQSYRGGNNNQAFNRD
ncbi:uncharacterized protein LOC128960173 [Oppia nitens]|uniref:uncharacterized protein LOC128960173 n=1 Tax=Oppia nitens TaxID=1686743 RepID=UPI0023DC1508|nr:uncharacterized protein LOC128960173 [Oppia nitens]